MLVLVENPLTSKADSVIEHTSKYPSDPQYNHSKLLPNWETFPEAGRNETDAYLKRPKVLVISFFLITNKKLLAGSHLPQMLLHTSLNLLECEGLLDSFQNYYYFLSSLLLSLLAGPHCVA